MANNARINMKEEMIKAGYDPATGNPIRISAGHKLKDNLIRNFSIMDEQNAINCFTWYNLPGDLTPQIMERILYYRGQGIFFYFEPMEKFYFLPFVPRGLDEYGRPRTASPLPFNGKSTYDESEEFIPGKEFDILYEVQLPEEFMNEDGTFDLEGMKDVLTNSCVILRDYSSGIAQHVQDRFSLNKGIINVMSDMIPFARTALLNGTGVQGLRVNDAGQYPMALAASNAVNHAALNGQKWVPTAQSMELQELTSGPVAKAEEYFLALQSLDNLRLSLYGLDNGGLFQKKSHMLEAEQEMNQGNVGLVMRDRLQQRQNFCTLINSAWGLGIWCEISEVAIGMDKDGDMVAGDNEDKGTNANGQGGKKEVKEND